LIYVEEIRRDRSVALEVFRHHARQDWSADEDVLVANLARTMKLGPEPHHMCWWRIPGIARLDAWERHLKTVEGRLYLAESPVAKVMEFHRCGLYDVCLGEGEMPSGLHLVEFFADDGRGPEEIADRFAARARTAPAGTLTYVLRRVGLLAPDPGGIAVWTFGSYAEAEPFARAEPKIEGCSVVAAGLYRRFGEDVP
jgi:hypothetical protein